MNETIELHDSELASVARDGTTVVATFDPAYIHRSEGRPGIDAGSGWLQRATFTFSDGSVSSPVNLPCGVGDGTLRIGGVLHDNGAPTTGEFEGSCELQLVLQDSAVLAIHGGGLVVRLHGEPRYLEEFPGLGHRAQHP